MTTRFAPEGLASTCDHLSWALLTAPDFKGRFTLDEIFDDLVHGINTVKAKTRSTEKLGIFYASLAKLAESKAAFVAGEMKPAHHALQKAGQLLRSLE